MSAEYLRMNCTACGGGVEFPVEGVGENIPCPHCNVSLTLAAPAKPPPLPPRIPPANPPLLGTNPQPAQVRCPKCQSTQLSANQKGFGMGGAAAGLVLLGPAGLLAGLVGSGKVKITCLACGHVFLPGKTAGR